jgi:hypothetical protein
LMLLFHNHFRRPEGIATGSGDENTTTNKNQDSAFSRLRNF